VRGSGRRSIVLLVVLVGQFMAALDTTAANLAALPITQGLDAGIGAVQLAIAAYTTTYASFLIAGSRLGASRGRRETFLAGVVVFTLSSLLAGAAGTAVDLIVARAAQGVGAALMVPQVISLIQIEFHGQVRARALTAYGTMIGLGAALGLLAGGWLIDADPLGLGWRVVFLVNLPIGALLLAVGAWVLPRLEESRAPIDFGGAALLSTAAMAVATALALGPGDGWPVWSFAALAAGCLLLWAFVVSQRRRQHGPLAPVLDLAVFSTSGVPAGVAAIFLSGVSYAGLLFCVAAFLQGHMGYSPLETGLALLPFAVGFGLGSGFGGRVPVARHHLLITLGFTLLGASLVALAATAGGSWESELDEALLAAAGLGFGVGFNPLVGTVVADVRPDHVADASGIATTAFQFSSVLGVALFGSLYEGSGLGLALAGMGAMALAAALVVAVTWVRTLSPANEPI
jgi:MFS family permease